MYGRALVGIATAAALALPAAGNAATLSGVVVAHDSQRGAWVVANRSGHLELVRTRRRLGLGQRVIVRGRMLADGMLVASRIRSHGHAASVRIHGVVLAHERSTFTLADNGATVQVSDTGNPPADGTSASTVDSVTPGGLSEDSEHSQNANRAELSGVVSGFVAATPTTPGSLTLTPDNSQTPLTIIIPAGSDRQFNDGDVVEVRVNVATDPSGAVTYTLAAARHEGHDRGADGVHADGVLTINADGTVTIAGDHGSVTLTAAADQLVGFTTGQCVRARGHVDTTGVVLDRIRASEECGGQGGQQANETQARGPLTINGDGTITVNAAMFMIGSFDMTGFNAGDCVEAHGVTAPGQTTPALVELHHEDSCTA
jgi:hypothetical protein